MRFASIKISVINLTHIILDFSGITTIMMCFMHSAFIVIIRCIGWPGNALNYTHLYNVVLIVLHHRVGLTYEK